VRVGAPAVPNERISACVGNHDLIPGHTVSGCVPCEVLDGVHISKFSWGASLGANLIWDVG
jgi:hypothetical protein